MAATNFYTDCNTAMTHNYYNYAPYYDSYQNSNNWSYQQNYNQYEHYNYGLDSSIYSTQTVLPVDMEQTNKTAYNKRKIESEEKEDEQPSTLRALLTHPAKKLKYTPDYIYEHTKPTSLLQENASNIEELLAEADLPTPSTQTVMSPHCSELDYVDIFSPQSSKQSSHSYKHGDYSTPPPPLPTVAMPPSTVVSPKKDISSYVEGISTPPLSPNDKNVTKISKQHNEINHTILTGIEFDWSQNEDNSSFESYTVLYKF